MVGEENLLLLAACPGDEVVTCGGLIAEGCRIGRPPFVVILTDNGHEERCRLAMRWLRLPPDRLLHAGLAQGTLPAGGPFFQSIVAALATLSWRIDCNIVCAPAASDEDEQGRLGVIARAVCQVAKLPRLFHGAAPMEALALDVSAHLAVKRAALAAYQCDPAIAGSTEIFGRE